MAFRQTHWCWVNIPGGMHLSLRYMELGYDITSAELDDAYKSFTNLADRKKRIYDQDLISLLSIGTRRLSSSLSTFESQPGRCYELDSAKAERRRIKRFMRIKITTLPGDGIGPEVTAEAVRVLQTIAGIHGHQI